jgi:hypothetical protein
MLNCVATMACLTPSDAQTRTGAWIVELSVISIQAKVPTENNRFFKRSLNVGAPGPAALKNSHPTTMQ